MLEEVYNYLHDFGFTSIDLDRIEKENNELFFSSISEVRKNIYFLKENSDFLQNSWFIYPLFYGLRKKLRLRFQHR